MTIATNMAGRGTDILLGGNPEFLTLQSLREKEPDSGDDAEAGTRSDPRTLAWEFAARSTTRSSASAGCTSSAPSGMRPGASTTSCAAVPAARAIPGSSRFYLSLEDDLMRIFASDRISGIMQSLGMEEGVPIESKLITRQIERAQKQVEARNFEIRKHLLEYDDVMNKQREAIYAIRRELLEGADQREYILKLANDILIDMIDRNAPREESGDWDLEGLRIAARQPVRFRYHGAGIRLSRKQPMTNWLRSCVEAVKRIYEEKERRVGPEFMRFQERMIMLQVLDMQWKDHLLALDHLKEGIGLRGYGQRDPSDRV